ncbi:DNA cytosine methyltransferase [Paenibacillus radicis (ex Gao et al. 2016)]|uniref:Cytosine-specific methyltransferase n=1 Tax=Paenibacillus radicis (ex Gao et al. 2016) TaxID=1737354 RepID=A0A917LVW8_9BACL|nr:DNA (cytosine-5-)-methyltransferase [Paenibacillus radicis (ex Gao et al. 2016)]GGG60486.1 cytosine-specific methyltransferase [Paenibacillus radicis (ex Gao et al. 2016)]
MYTLASLFTGCGGGDLGLKGGFTFMKKRYSRLPFSLVYANEINEKIADIFNGNFSAEADVRDIRNVKDHEIPKHDVLVGGFPCVSFSIVAQNPKRLGIKNDESGMLFFEMCRILRDKQPKAFIAENVKGLLSANKGEAISLIIDAFSKCGYKVKYEVLNAADYGVPQNRYRVIIVGIRNDIQSEFSFPEPTHNQRGENNRKKHIPLGDIIFSESEVDEKYFFSEKAVQGMLNAKKDMNKGRAQELDRPCNTVGAHLAKVSLNSTDPVLMINGNYRRFTPREVARIQSFPDSFQLVGSEGTQYRALGNAIPPVLMWQVAKELAETLKRAEECNEVALIKIS